MERAFMTTELCTKIIYTLYIHSFDVISITCTTIEILACCTCTCTGQHGACYSFFLKHTFVCCVLLLFCVHMIIVQGRNINSAVYYIFEHKLHSPSMYDRR